MKRILFILFIVFFILIFMSCVKEKNVTTPEVEISQSSNAPITTVNNITLYAGYKDYRIQLANVSKDAVFSYSSSNNNAASVSSNGIVKPNNEGTAIITVAISQNNSIYVTNIDVIVKYPYLQITDKVEKIEVGDIFDFKYETRGIDIIDLS